MLEWMVDNQEALKVIFQFIVMAIATVFGGTIWYKKLKSMINSELVDIALRIIKGVVVKTYKEKVKPMQSNKGSDGWTEEQVKEIQNFAWDELVKSAKETKPEVLKLGKDYLKAKIEEQVNEMKKGGKEAKILYKTEKKTILG